MKTFLIKIFIDLCLMLLIACSADNNELIYQMNISNDSPLLANITIDTSMLQQFMLEQPRSLPFTDNKNKLNIKCVLADGSETNIIFNEYVNCQTIQWNIEFKQLANGHYDASSQQNIYSPQDWWLFSEWDDLPRVKGRYAAKICIHNNFCQEIPDKYSTPLLLVWGNSTAKLAIGNIQLSIFTDNHLLTSEIPRIKNLIEKQLNYLNDIFSPDNKVSHQSLVWIAIDESYGIIGGAAGYNTYVSNYLMSNGELTSRSISHLLRVSAHETVHMLSQYTFSTWMSESLAEYYAYKSLMLSGVLTKSPLEVWRVTKSNLDNAETSLYQAHKRVVENNDMTFYSLFYLKGAAFWQEVDTALEVLEDSLDNYIELLDGNDNQSITLGLKFQEKMINNIGQEQWQMLYNDYF